MAVPEAAGLALAKPLAELQPAGVWKGRAEEDEVGLRALGQIERLTPLLGRHHLEPVVGQVVMEVPPSLGLGLGDEESGMHAADRSNGFLARPDVLFGKTATNDLQPSGTDVARRTTTEEVTITANGLRFHALAAGPADGPLVLCLHGFPEFSRSWRHQLPALADAGYRAVAPDLRGYGGTEKRGPYDVRTLAADAAALVRALGRERAVVVGHDWGGAIAWTAAHVEPDVVERLVVLNCPHPATLASELLRNPRQLARSSYIFLFQLPRLPEWMLTRERAAMVARSLRGGSHVRSAWPPEELDRYRDAFLRPGVATAALSYYRAAFRRPLTARRAASTRPISAPTLILWGVHDAALGEEVIATEKLAPWFAPGTVPEIRWIEEAGHFVQSEAPERVNAELLSWLGEARRSEAPGPENGP